MMCLLYWVINTAKICISNSENIYQQVLENLIKFNLKNKTMKNVSTILNHIEWSSYYKLPKTNSEWVFISCSPNLSEEFIDEFQNKVNWRMIVLNQKLSEDFIRNHKDKLELHLVAAYQYPENVSAALLEELYYQINWQQVFDLVPKHKLYLYEQFKKYL